MDVKNRLKKNKRKILLVEDNHLNIRIMSRLLQGMGVDIVEASSKKEAIKIAVEENFSMIFICIFMPETIGYEIIKKIRELSEINKDTPIIAVSSSSYNSMTNKMMEWGIEDVISKPLKESELLILFKKYTVEKILSKPQTTMNFSMFDNKEFESFYNDDSLQKEIILTFINERDNDLDRMNEAFHSKNIDKIYEALHYMKGSFSYLKAKKILELTQQILDLLKVKNLKDALLLERTFYNNYNTLFKELNFYINSL